MGGAHRERGCSCGSSTFTWEIARRLRGAVNGDHAEIAAREAGREEGRTFIFTGPTIASCESGIQCRPHAVLRRAAPHHRAVSKSSTGRQEAGVFQRPPTAHRTRSSRLSSGLTTSTSSALPYKRCELSISAYACVGRARDTWRKGRLGSDLRRAPEAATPPHAAEAVLRCAQERAEPSNLHAGGWRAAAAQARDAASAPLLRRLGLLHREHRVAAAVELAVAEARVLVLALGPRRVLALGLARDACQAARRDGRALAARRRGRHGPRAQALRARRAPLTRTVYAAIMSTLTACS